MTKKTSKKTTKKTTKKTSKKKAAANGASAKVTTARLSDEDLDERTREIVAVLRKIECIEADKKADAAKHRKKLRELKQQRDELREEIATGMMAPSKRQQSLALGDEPEPQGDGSVKTNSKQIKRKRTKKVSAPKKAGASA